MKKDPKENEEGYEPDDSVEEEAGEDNSDKGVVVSEDFQRRLHSILDGASKEELAFAHTLIYKCEDEMRKKEKPTELSTEGMPE